MEPNNTEDQDKPEFPNNNVPKMPMATLELFITGSLLELAGYIIFFVINWKLGVALFLCSWGKNVLRRIGF